MLEATLHHNYSMHAVFYLSVMFSSFRFSTSFWETPEMAEDLISIHTPFSRGLICFSVGE